MLNRIFIFFFISAFVVCGIQYVLYDNYSIFETAIDSIFTLSKVSVEIAIGLVGMMCFWLGMMRIAENSGLINKLSSFISPLFQRLMPEVPNSHPAMGSITMNLSANFLGLDNAATPLGLKAMSDLQSLNKTKDTATNAQILFLVLNTSSITLFPMSVFIYRAQQDAAIPTDVFLPILLATFSSSIVGLLCVAYVQKINLLNRVVLLYLVSAFAVIFSLVLYFAQLSTTLLAEHSSFLANFSIFLLIVLFITTAWYKKIDVYASFIDGAKHGFDISIKIIPYLIAILCAIGVFRASGALDYIVEFIRYVVRLLGFDTRFVDSLPTAFMKPLSGSGARAMMIETMNTHGADSFAGRLSSIMQGSTETTFYVLAVYFGSVGIKYTRHAVSCSLIADVAGLSAAIAVCYWFFG